MRIVDMFRFNAREHPRREFAVDARRSLTYGEADQAVLRIVTALRASGLGPGDRVAIIACNSIEFALFYLGCALVGCVPVPLNYRLAGRELAYILNDSEARLIVADAQYAPAVQDIRPQVPTLHTFVAINDYTEPGWVPWARWTDGPAAVEDSLPTLPGLLPVVQAYTSGTTGRPKGVLMSNDAMAWYAMVQGAPLHAQGVLQGRLLVVAPMFHAGITALWFTSVAWGGSLYLQERFAAQSTVDALRNEGISWTLLIPAMIQLCLIEAPDVAKAPYEKLQLIAYGGSAIAEQTLQTAIRVFDCGFIQQYGLTETNAVINLSPQDHHEALASRPERLLAAGRPLPGCGVRVVDSEGRDVPAGEIGEILLRGPQLMTGYWRNDGATAETLRDGWLWTGDAGSLDDDGYLYVRDRIKDMIVTGGENVYSREVEDVLFDHPDIADAAVIGVPDERWGEAVKAIVVAAPGRSVDPDEVIGFCRAHLAGFKCPKSLEIIDELPRNPSGKVLKSRLREAHLAATALSPSSG